MSIAHCAFQERDMPRSPKACVTDKITSLVTCVPLNKLQGPRTLPEGRIGRSLWVIYSQKTIIWNQTESTKYYCLSFFFHTEHSKYTGVHLWYLHDICSQHSILLIIADGRRQWKQNFITFAWDTYILWIGFAIIFSWHLTNSIVGFSNAYYCCLKRNISRYSFFFLN